MRIGIDLGGTKIEGLMLDRDGREIARRRAPTPRMDYDGTVSAVAGLVRQLEREAGAMATVGVGMPGAVSPATGRVKNANSTWLIGRSLREDLETALARPVRVANDADCFALSEATDGAAAGLAVVFGVILGTGVGGGLVVRGGLLEGPNAIAGEWGHNPLPFHDLEEPIAVGDLPGCYCGRRGCVETFLSGPGLARDFTARTGRTEAPDALERLAAAGDVMAEACLARYEDRLARGLATVINLLDPDAIVLGGGVSNLRRLYQQVPGRWARYVFSDAVTTRLLPPAHGDSSGVRGAAWLWPAGGGQLC